MKTEVHSFSHKGATLSILGDTAAVTPGLYIRVVVLFMLFEVGGDAGL